jgi:GAF domain-containing protein
MSTQRALSSAKASEDTFFSLRRRYIQVLALCSVCTALIGIPSQVIADLQRGEVQIFPALITSAFLVANLFLLLLARQNRIVVATVILITVYGIGFLQTSFPISLLLAILLCISAATLTSLPVYVAANAIVIGKYAYDTTRIVQGGPTSFTPEVTTHLIVIISLLVVSLTTRYFVSTAQRAVALGERYSHLLQAIASIGQVTATMLELDTLLPQAVDLIRDRLAFYHAQVFLVNENGDQAILAASTGEVGQQLLKRQHRLAVGSRSVIGRVTQSGEPALARDTDRDALYYRNELLPNTRSELALPLLDGNKIIGALDVQSTRPDAFQPNDIQALQALANQLATAIRNARLFEQQRLSAQENKRFFLEAEANLREIQRLNQQLTKTGWANFVRDHRTHSGVTLEADRVVQDSDWSETLAAASEKREPVTHTNGDGQVIAVPVMLRGEVIGAIEVEPGTEVNEADAVDMVQAVAQRLAVSLDNARLFEEAQVATAQEQHINAIVSQYQSVNSVDDLLRITLTELSQSLGAQRGAIRLGSAPQESLNGGHA